MNHSSSQPPKPPATWAIVLAFTLLYTAWGTTYLAIKRGVQNESLPPALFGGTRICLAGLLLLGYLAVRGRPLGLSRRDLALVAMTGCLLFVAGNGLVTLAQKTVPSSVAAVLVATTPLWVGLLGMCWPGGERLGGRGWLGLLIGLGGVLILLSPRLHDLGALVRDLGPLLVLGSAGSWALGSLVMRHHRLRGSHLTAAAYQMVLGGGALALVGLAAGETEQLPDHVTMGAAGAFFYLLVVGSLVGFVSYNWLLGHVTAAQASTYAYVNPAVAVLVGWADGEDMTPWLLAGIGVILAGVALVRGGAGPRPAESKAPATEEPPPCPALLREADRALPAGYDK